MGDCKRDDRENRGKSNENSRNNSPQRGDSNGLSAGYSHSSVVNGYGGKGKNNSVVDSENYSRVDENTYIVY